MKRVILTLLLLVAVPVLAQAQPQVQQGASLAWDYTQADFTTVGTHMVDVRACNAVLCGAEISVSFVLVVQPAAPSNLRIIPK